MTLICRRPDTTTAPCSFTQEWFYEQQKKAPEDSSWNMATALRLEGPLDPDALSNAVNAIAQRHEALRTTFAETLNGPCQRITSPPDTAISTLDLRPVDRSQRVARAAEIAKQLGEKPFDLCSQPPFELSMLQLEDNVHWLIFSIHHIVCDGWSIGLFFKELSDLYNYYCGGSPLSLEPVPLHMGDYSAWEREYWRGETLTKCLSYWQQRLLPLSRFSLTSLSPQITTYTAATHTLTLNEARYEQLRSAARHYRVPPSMIMLTAYSALLRDLTGRDDITITTPIANRATADSTGIFGYLLDTIVLRFRRVRPFDRLISDARQTILSAFEHQLPLAALFRGLNIAGSWDTNPLTDATINYMPTGGEQMPTWHMLASTPLDVFKAKSRYPLKLYIGDSGASIHMNFVYLPDILPTNRLLMLADAYVDFLEEFSIC
jgi:hypothetical protein